MSRKTRLKRLLPAERIISDWLRDFLWEVSLGFSWRWGKPQGTSCHLNKLLFWIQLWWQLQCQVATERNTVLFFWWARSFEVSKLILWDLLSKAVFGKTDRQGTISLLLPPPQVHRSLLFPLLFQHLEFPLAANGSSFLFLLEFMSPFSLYSNDLTQEQVFLGEDTIGTLVEN